MKRFLKTTVLVFAILIVSLMAEFTAFALPQSSANALLFQDSPINADIEFSVDDQTKNVSVRTEYRDGYFGQAATAYNHGLARVSAVVSAAAYEAPDNQKSSDVNWRANNIFRAAEKLGFWNIVTYNYDENFLRVSNYANEHTIKNIDKQNIVKKR